MKIRFICWGSLYFPSGLHVLPCFLSEECSLSETSREKPYPALELLFSLLFLQFLSEFDLYVSGLIQTLRFRGERGKVSP